MITTTLTVSPRTRPVDMLRVPISTAGRLLDRLGIDRRSRPLRDHQRRRAEEELVDAVGRAVLRELLQVEDLAVHDPDRGNRHPVPGLEDVGPGIVRANLDAPGVATDARDLLAVDPVDRLEGQAGRVAAGVAAPLAAREPVFHLPGADDHEVAAPYGDVLRARRGVELGDRDPVAVRETSDALPARDVQQHTSPDHLVREFVDAVLVGVALV